MVRVTIKGFMIDSVSEMPVVLLKEQGSDKTIPLFTGPFETGAIILELKGIKPLRPVAHDLIASMFKRHRIYMECLEIYDLFDGLFFSRIRYRKGFRPYTMETKPGDGLALAIRLNAPIYMDEKIIHEISRDNNRKPVSDKNITALNGEFLFLNSENYSKRIM